MYEALVKSFVGKGKTVEAAQAYIEELKEEERYVLEVCFSFFSICFVLDQSYLC